MWVTRLFKTSDDDIVCGPGILRLPFEEDGAIYVANWGAGAPSAPGSIFIQSCVSPSIFAAAHSPSRVTLDYGNAGRCVGSAQTSRSGSVSLGYCPNRGWIKKPTSRNLSYVKPFTASDGLRRSIRAPAETLVGSPQSLRGAEPEPY